MSYRFRLEESFEKGVRRILLSQIGVAERQLSTPADRLNTPTDRQTILLGRLNKVYGTAGQNPDGVYHGNVGFIVE